MWHCHCDFSEYYTGAVSLLRTALHVAVPVFDIFGLAASCRLSANAAERRSLKVCRSTKWRWRLNWLWTLPWTEATSGADSFRSEEHASELQSLLRISYSVSCL